MGDVTAAAVAADAVAGRWEEADMEREEWEEEADRERGGESGCGAI
jgi:hypothetical protein